jgi:mono/diheme cytochrome c family protein
MKKQILSTVALFAAILALMAFTYPHGKNGNPPQDKVVSLFPEDVQKVLETSCFDCHTDAASNTKAKMKLNFSKWGELSDAKKVGKMESINEVVSKGDMPPGKYVTNYPDRAPGKEQKDIISKWVTEESAKLMGQ